MNRLLEFAAARIGRRVQSIGGLGGECVDLVELWIALLGRAPVRGNAVDLLQNADQRDWNVTRNGPYNFPTAGSIVVWGPSVHAGIGPYGHTAIAIYADAQWLVTLDQNWPAGQPVGFVLHDYGGVIGWMVPR